MVKKQFFVTMLALTCAITLAGCGSSSGSSAMTAPASSEAPNVVNEEPASDETPEEDEDWYEDEGAEWAQDIETPEEPEEANVSVPVGMEPAIEGIITLQVNYLSMSHMSLDVTAIDPDTGDYRNITSFLFDTAPANATEYLITPSYERTRYINYRDLFNEDYTLIAATKTFVGNDEDHAGWVDQSGEFFDVTVALNEQAQSDFDPIVHYEAVGFTPDGQFCYADCSDWRNLVYYLVPLDNITPGASYLADDADPYVMDVRSSAWHWVRINQKTCVVDENHFLMVENANNSVVCAIVDITSQAITPIVSGESLTSWSPVIGPDGTSVALMATPKKGTDNPSIYLTNLEGNSPTKLETSYPIICGRVAGNGSPMWRISVAYYYTGILEWR